MKRQFVTYVMLFITLTMVYAQKIDCRLTELVDKGMRQNSMKLSVDDVCKDNYAAPHDIDTVAVKEEINVTFSNDGEVEVISAIARLKKDAVCPVGKLQQLGISVTDVVGNVLIMSVPPESLLDLEEIEEIEYVAADNLNKLYNDKARTKTNIDCVDGSDIEKLEESGLPHAYTGKDVIIGIVDVGIDFNHAAFRDANGNTRIKKVVTFDSSGNKLVYTDAEEIAALTTDRTTYSHGSHTSCTAGGSKVGDTNLHGMAPDADLVLCGLGNSLANSRIIASIGEIFSYADEVGKPAVINISLGDDLYFRDGVTSALVTAIRALNDDGAASGRIVCISAGNDGNGHRSIVQTLAAAGDDGYCLRTVLGESGTTTLNDVEVAYYRKIKLFAYDNDGGDFTAVLKAIDITSGTLYDLSEKPLYTSTTSTKPVTALALTLNTDVTNGKKYVRLSNSKTYYFHEPDLRLALLITGTEGQKMRLENGMDNNSTEGFYAKDIAGYTDGNAELSININACDDAVISVGAYTARTSWKSINGKSYHYTDTSQRTDGSIASFSSFSTDDNGVNRPDVVAPGVGVLSAYNMYDTTFFDGNGVVSGGEAKIHCNETLNGRDNYYGVMSGTSMSSPCAAGIIALWLQANPTLSTADIREIIRTTSYNDEYTTDVANIPSGDITQAGSGKIDALAGLQTIQETTPSLHLYDGDAYTATEDRIYTDGVTYTRTFPSSLVNKWTSLYVPFAINIADYTGQFDIAEIFALCPIYDTNGDGEVTAEDDAYLILMKKTSGMTFPNKPYLIRVKSSGVHEIDAVDGKTYASSNGMICCSTTAKSYMFTGTYSTVAANADNSYWYMSGGSLNKKTSGTANILPNRWYMAISDIEDNYAIGSQTQSSLYIAVVGENAEDATAVNTIMQDNRLQGNTIYNLAGQRVGKTNKPGVYVVNGKKVVK